MSCGVARRHGSDPVLLWLWCRPVATALVRPLAWEPPYVVGAALEKTKKKKEIVSFFFFFQSFYMPVTVLNTFQAYFNSADV